MAWDKTFVDGTGASSIISAADVKQIIDALDATSAEPIYPVIGGTLPSHSNGRLVLSGSRLKVSHSASALHVSETLRLATTSGRLFRATGAGAIAEFQDRGFAGLAASSAIIGTSSAPDRVLVEGSNQKYYELRFDDATTEECFWQFPAPVIWNGSDVDITIWWACAATSGNLHAQIGLRSLADNDIIDATLTTNTITDTAKGDANRLNKSTVTVSAPTGAGDGMMMCQLERLGANGADTLSGDAKIILVTCELNLDQA